ncbi:MAG: SH3 domain-containing protein [Anaerolineae bacterium]|nr:SH3 domain-containing protein [Anaerolineae bacterium]
MWRKVLIVTVLLLLVSVAVVQPALAQNPVWHAEYYNNPTLSGSPVITRNDNNIAFNWGAGSPDASINSDNFSVRWAADVALTPGTYRFYAQADDNIRIIFNFVSWSPVIDTFASGQVNQLVTGDVNVPTAGTYHIQVDYRELTDQALAFVSFANLATNPTGPGFPAPSNPVPVPTSAWLAQYFSNSGLLGDPAAILTEYSPSHQWGNSAPLSSLPADNFSARWTSSQNLAGGNYTISARVDDGVRVYVNGSLVINEWHGASSQTYSVNVTLPAGSNYFVVEYYEATGNAYLEFSIAQVGTTTPPTQPSPTGATITVTAYRLNVRALPDPVNGQVLVKINRLETYPVLGRNANTTWYQINVNGTVGWVSSGYVNVNNGGNIPVVGSDQQAPPPSSGASGNQVVASPYNVVIRQGPSTGYQRIGLLPVTGIASVIGRTSGNTWWQINFNGLIGWVSADYAHISATANISSIPVTG